MGSRCCCPPCSVAYFPAPPSIRSIHLLPAPWVGGCFARSTKPPPPCIYLKEQDAAETRAGGAKQEIANHSQFRHGRLPDAVAPVLRTDVRTSSKRTASGRVLPAMRRNTLGLDRTRLKTYRSRLHASVSTAPCGIGSNMMLKQILQDAAVLVRRGQDSGLRISRTDDRHGGVRRLAQHRVLRPGDDTRGRVHFSEGNR